MQRCSKMHCPFLVSQYYRHRRQCEYLSLTSLPSLVNTKTTTFLVQKGPEKQTLLVIIFALDLGYSPFEHTSARCTHI